MSSFVYTEEILTEFFNIFADSLKSLEKYCLYIKLDLGPFLQVYIIRNWSIITIRQQCIEDIHTLPVAFYTGLNLQII